MSMTSPFWRPAHKATVDAVAELLVRVHHRAWQHLRNPLQDSAMHTQ
eukprot:SAG22_NODE_106_length_19904_cov_14.387175_8_plen_47_part_00